MAIVISNSNPDPLYKQIKDQIKEAITEGSLLPNTRLPSVRLLARELQISVITIKRAYTDLEGEGYIVTRPGLGSFVAELNRARLREEKLCEILEGMTRLVRSGEKFGISPEEILRLMNERGVNADGKHTGSEGP